MEGNIIIGILCYDYFSLENCEDLFKSLHYIFYEGGLVRRGKARSGGNMIMCGWHHDKLLHKPRIYGQSNRKNKLNKTTAIQLHRKGGQICDQVMNHL